MANALLQENAMGFKGKKVESQGKEYSGCKDFSSNDHKYFDGKSWKSKKPFEQDLIRHKIRHSAIKNFDQGRYFQGKDTMPRIFLNGSLLVHMNRWTISLKS